MNDKNRKVLGTILLFIVLIIIKLFLGGVYLYHFFEELIPELIIWGVISFVMMIVPTICRIKKKEKLENKLGKKVCFLNSSIIFIISILPCIPTLINQDKYNGMVISFNPISFAKRLIVIFLFIGIIYYFINYLYYVKSK